MVPVEVYSFFKKRWVEECTQHAALAEGTPFVAAIATQFDADVDFDGTVLPCHVAVLEDIKGPTLQQLLREPVEFGLTPRMAAQVSADLFEILQLFVESERSHNDLHSANIIVKQLRKAELRSGAVEPSVRAVAIDLGSTLDGSVSGPRRLGDQHSVARHLAELAAAVRRAASEHSDVNHRIAEAIRGLAEHLAPEAVAQRVMTINDAVEALRRSMQTVDEPWDSPLQLRRFGDAYNAQAIGSWHVPQLWFDPANQWIRSTTARGPLVVTGMRGCGKTMLLRALHFHARAVMSSNEAAVGGPPFDADSFVGVYASCQKLLNPQELGAAESRERSTIKRPFERLYVAYLRDAVQVLRHLRSLRSEVVLGGIEQLLRPSLSALDGLPELSQDAGEQLFVSYLTDLQFDLADDNSDCRLKASPAEAFAHLADVLRASSSAFRNKYLLFLLDDASTRYLHQNVLRDVISQLLFQHEHCAFRITTEAQALHRLVLSPGGSAPADPGRDYEEFDLGNEVVKALRQRSTREGMRFVSEILRRRGRHFVDSVYRREPVEILGDVQLETIAREIHGSTASSPARKSVYRGLRALTSVCVGDLGDVVKLYERILRHAVVDELPVPSRVQSDCFLEHSASLVHVLNRRDQTKKALALGFAQAAGELLQRSTQGLKSDDIRLRQYTKVYVRIDARDNEEEVRRLLDLLDAGVFVYDSGRPRTKTRDHDPVLQCILSFRKLLGLGSYMGLADRDRFELSGAVLREWLLKPDEAQRILMEREMQGGLDEEESEVVGAEVEDEVLLAGRGQGEGSSAPVGQLPVQIPLDLSEPEGTVLSIAPSLGVSAERVELGVDRPDGQVVVVLGLGFEERARVSAARVLDQFPDASVVLVEYGELQGGEIRERVERDHLGVTVLKEPAELRRVLEGCGPEDAILVDTSGLSKPFLFIAIQQALRNGQEVSVVHTLAEEYYPKNDELRSMGVTAEEGGGDLLSRLEGVLTGEEGPYRLECVYREPSDPQRSRCLIASASAKNDRLLHLLDQRSFDAVRLFVPEPTTPRRRAARAAAELAESAAEAPTRLVNVETNDVQACLAAAERAYNEMYHSDGASVELGLTGSKMHAVALAALSAATRVSCAWYVAPESFDEARFTRGVADTRCFRVRLER